MKIAVGLSGDVDSSVAAALLKEQGHEVVGIAITTKTISMDEFEKLLKVPILLHGRIFFTNRKDVRHLYMT